MNKRVKVLLIINQCNPDWASVPLVGYNFYNSIKKVANVKLVTHERNRPALNNKDDDIDFIEESFFSRIYYRILKILTLGGRINWAVMHTLTYPIYEDFNRKCFRRYKDDIRNKKYDIVHAMTPIIPRFPYKVIRACTDTPFILGPVNGGIPFPDAFKNLGKKEFAHFNFLRSLTKLLPDYTRTYTKADLVLAGSSYTRDFILNKFQRKLEATPLFHENGIDGEYIGEAKKLKKERVDLLFVGRLVPYKGAAIALDVLNEVRIYHNISAYLKIVGDGPERAALESQAKELGLLSYVDFTGWISHESIHEIYKESDIFLFPSIREFGGAVVLEAMARGIPCVVPAYGGVGEYVNDSCGYSIPLDSKEILIKRMTEAISELAHSEELYTGKSRHAIARVREYAWNRKGDSIVTLYNDALGRRES